MQNEIKVDRAELIDGLTRLKKALKRKAKSDAVLTLEHGQFIVFLDGISIEASAVGTFQGMVRIPGGIVLNLAEVLPNDDPLMIGHDEQRLFIGPSFSMPCVWHNATPNPIQLPMEPSLPILLGVRFKHTHQEIFQSGLTERLAKAEAMQKRLVGRATNVLAPLEVPRAEIEKLVDEVVKRINKL